MQLLGEVDHDDLRIALRLEAVPETLQASAPLVVVGQLAVVHHGKVGERIGPIGVRAGDVDVRLGRHADVPDGMGAAETAEPVLLSDRDSVPEVLDDLEGVPYRQHLAAGDVLDVVDERLQIPFVVELDPAGVLGDDLDAVQHRSDLAQTSLELEAVTLEPLAEVDLRRPSGSASLIRMTTRSVGCP